MRSIGTKWYIKLLAYWLAGIWHTQSICLLHTRERGERQKGRWDALEMLVAEALIGGIMMTSGWVSKHFCTIRSLSIPLKTPCISRDLVCLDRISPFLVHNLSIFPSTSQLFPHTMDFNKSQVYHSIFMKEASQWS